MNGQTERFISVKPYTVICWLSSKPTKWLKIRPHKSANDMLSKLAYAIRKLFFNTLFAHYVIYKQRHTFLHRIPIKQNKLSPR